MDNIRLEGTANVTVTVTERDIAGALYQVIKDKLGLDEKFDDAGLDWMTYGHTNVYIGGRDWQIVSARRDVVALVDAMNVLLYGIPVGVYNVK